MGGNYFAWGHQRKPFWQGDIWVESWVHWGSSLGSEEYLGQQEQHVRCEHNQCIPGRAWSPVIDRETDRHRSKNNLYFLRRLIKADCCKHTHSITLNIKKHWSKSCKNKMGLHCLEGLPDTMVWEKNITQLILRRGKPSDSGLNSSVCFPMQAVFVQ